MSQMTLMSNHWAATKMAPGVFSADECARIIALREILANEQGITTNHGDDTAFRDSRVSWIRPNEETRWIFEKTGGVIQRVNGGTYKMELTGFGEPLQLAEYAPGHHYDWHIDLGSEQTREVARKLSFIVQLSQEHDYEGGDVQVLYSPEPMTLSKVRGTFIVFPSYVLHRVQPVTRGRRFSLVGWMAGPPFR